MSDRTRAAAVLAECQLLATMTEEPGRTTRRFLTPPVAQVHAYLRRRMEELGMAVSIDAVGNLRGCLQSDASMQKRLVIGSHIDTVPDAGAFDGVLGVVLALHLAAEARASSLPLAIEVVAFSEEEGVRFGVPFLGSRAMAGRFDPALLALTDAEGISVGQAIANFGLNSGLNLALNSGPGIGAIEEAIVGEDAIGFFEIHIEQGPVLEAEGLSVAVVTAIVGQTRCKFSFQGRANHAGTTPMHLRQDAMTTAAEWILAVEALANKTDGLVATVGRIVAQPNAGNVIAANVRVSLDLRHARDFVREEAIDTLTRQAEAIAARRGVRCEARRLLEQVAVPMDEEMTALLAESVAAAGFAERHMTSGAGHDAMVMATRLPTAMLFLRSPGGVSHHPDETVLEADVEAALKIGGLFLRRLCARSDWKR
ncbi:allantoate amidohydrolase [Acidicapsa ligni]|uniref:allantoate amidohydrolase n=1 Tax=Acidicapsa ligni TaxID=542300 RepID=UPI0021E0DE05|nr:allantoate amidohydrolase [Acidicapsa ligni]